MKPAIKNELPPIVMDSEEIEEAYAESLQREVNRLEAQEQAKRERKAQRTANTEKRLLRTSQAAKFLGISDWKLRQLVYDHQIAVLDGKYWRFDKSDLEAFIQRQKEVLP